MGFLFWKELDMYIYEINDRNEDIITNLLLIWDRSVRTTHLFLSEEELMQIREVENLILIKNNYEYLGFMGIERDKIEMIFVDSKAIGKGLGKELLNYGIDNYKATLVDVNEENTYALSFYEHMGFKVLKRDEVDSQGNPYPILHMKAF